MTRTCSSALSARWTATGLAAAVASWIECGERVLADEVNAGGARYADTSGLRLFREEYRERFAGGLLLHGGVETQWMGDGILAVPWWRIL